MNIQLTIKELSVCAKSLQSCLTLQQHGLKPARFLSPWDSPGKNTGVGSHSLLQGVHPDGGTEPESLALKADSLPSEQSGRPAGIC